MRRIHRNLSGYTQAEIKKFLLDFGYVTAAGETLYPFAVYDAARQTQTTAAEVDQAMNWPAGTAAQWVRDNGLPALPTVVTAARPPYVQPNPIPTTAAQAKALATPAVVVTVPNVSPTASTPSTPYTSGPGLTIAPPISPPPVGTPARPVIPVYGGTYSPGNAWQPGDQVAHWSWGIVCPANMTAVVDNNFRAQCRYTTTVPLTYFITEPLPQPNYNWTRPAVPVGSVAVNPSSGVTAPNPSPMTYPTTSPGGVTSPVQSPSQSSPPVSSGNVPTAWRQGDTFDNSGRWACPAGSYSFRDAQGMYACRIGTTIPPGAMSASGSPTNAPAVTVTVPGGSTAPNQGGGNAALPSYSPGGEQSTPQVNQGGFASIPTAYLVGGAALAAVLLLKK